MKDRKWIRQLANRLKNSFIKKHGYESKLIDFMFIAKKIGRCPSKTKFRWNIDHILPLSSFSEDISSVFRAWSFDNLAWLPRYVNGAKSNEILSNQLLQRLRATILPSALKYFDSVYTPKLLAQISR